MTGLVLTFVQHHLGWKAGDWGARPWREAAILAAMEDEFRGQDVQPGDPTVVAGADGPEEGVVEIAW